MRLIHRPLLIAVLHVVRHPWRVLAAASLALVICVGLAMWKLNIATDQNRLFDPNVSFFRDYLSFVERFPENEAIYIIVEPAAQKRDESIPVTRWTEIADRLTARLSELTQYVKSVDSRVPTAELGAQGLLFDEPRRVRQSFEEIKRFIPLVKLWGEQPSAITRVLGASPLERFITGLNLQKSDAETNQFVAMLARTWNQALEHPDQPASLFVPDLTSLDATDPSRLGYYYVPNEDDPSRKRYVLLVRVYDRTEYNSLTAISRTVEAIRGAVREVASGYPEFQVGITGRPTLAADEMRTTDRDTNRAEIIALAAVFVGLVVMLRSTWLALAGELALGVGIGWTFGWATLSIGELNLLSIVFLLALIGIGMDYLVQILTRYRQEVARRSRPETIWTSVFHHVALPINTACCGAAGAFLVSVLTHFRGAAQLGIIAGGGLLLCLLAGYVILPALLTIFPLRVRRGDQLPNLGPPARAGWSNLARPILWITLLLIGIPFAMKTDFDPGLLSLQSPKLQSVQLVHKLQTWSAVVLSKDLDTLRRAREAVRPSPLVERTESILMAYDNLDWLKAHENELPAIDWTQPEAIRELDLNRLARKAGALAKHLGETSPAGIELTRFADNLHRSNTDLAGQLSEWQRAFVEQLRGILKQFHPQQLDIEKLPAELRSHFVGTDGSFALYIYPKADLWNQANLATFVRDVESRMHVVRGQYTLTGIALNIFHSTASIEQSFYKATGYALILIVILVFLDLKHVGQTILAISVLAMGLPMLAALMGLLKTLALRGTITWIEPQTVNWNFANFFALPILIGAGHEYGVFLVHRYREALHDPRRAWRRWDVSDRALLLCAYVTCSSFGFFWAMAHHRGLQSLGLVMTLGTACIYLASIFVLRPLLIWMLARRRRSLEAAEQSRRPLEREIVHQE